MIKPVIDTNFTTDLILAILTSPVVYIPHFHYGYLQNAISNIIGNEGISRKIGIHSDEILEFDLYRGIFKFGERKAEGQSKLVRFLSDIIENDSTAIDDIRNVKLFLLNGAMSSIADDKECQNLISQFANYYHKGLFDRRRTIIIIEDFPHSSIPKQITPYIKVLNIPFPNDEAILNILRSISFSKSINKSQQLDLMDRMVCLMRGLHQYQIIEILSSALLKTSGFLSHTTYELCEKEKKNIVKKTNTLELIESKVSLDDIGGLAILKDDIRTKAIIFKNLSLALSTRVNLPLPKGILILGMPGCGKSLIAKAIAHEFGIPLLRLDIGKLMGKYVGESEENLRIALSTADASHPCVLWIDEVEKAFAGNNSGSNGDTLVVRLMGSFLTWMQERISPVYIIATANDAMRPEFMRKGRFDEVYFVNFPNKEEAKEIIKKKLEPYRNPDTIFDFQLFEEDSVSIIAEKMQCGKLGGFAGAEIEAVVTTVIENAFIKYVNTGQNHKVVIKCSDFESVIELTKQSIMSNQVGESGVKTNVERILDLQKFYKFKKASKS